MQSKKFGVNLVSRLFKIQITQRNFFTKVKWSFLHKSVSKFIPKKFNNIKPWFLFEQILSSKKHRCRVCQIWSLLNDFQHYLGGHAA